MAKQFSWVASLLQMAEHDAGPGGLTLGVLHAHQVLRGEADPPALHHPVHKAAELQAVLNERHFHAAIVGYGDNPRLVPFNVGCHRASLPRGRLLQRGGGIPGFCALFLEGEPAGGVLDVTPLDLLDRWQTIDVEPAPPFNQLGQVVGVLAIALQKQPDLAFGELRAIGAGLLMEIRGDPNFQGNVQARAEQMRPAILHLGLDRFSVERRGMERGFIEGRCLGCNCHDGLRVVKGG